MQLTSPLTPPHIRRGKKPLAHRAGGTVLLAPPFKGG
jgi:hypothetical protein